VERDRRLLICPRRAPHASAILTGPATRDDDEDEDITAE
jgi:hypothetical protein